MTPKKCQHQNAVKFISLFLSNSYTIVVGGDGGIRTLGDVRYFSSLRRHRVQIVSIDKRLPPILPSDRIEHQLSESYLELED